MNIFEYAKLLKEQLELLKQAQQEALDHEFYGDVAELSKQINMTGFRLAQCGIGVHKNDPC